MELDTRVAALKSAIRDVPDFPKKGIVFKDITTLLKDARLFREAMDLFTELCQRAPNPKVARDERVERLVGVQGDREDRRERGERAVDEADHRGLYALEEKCPLGH